MTKQTTENKLTTSEMMVGLEPISQVVRLKNEVSEMNIHELYTNTLSENTKINYISTIKSFFGVNNLSEISIEDMQAVTPEIANAWANQQMVEGIAKSTINRKLSAMKSFYKFLSRRNVRIVEYNPFDTSEGAIRFKNAAKDYSDKRVLDPKEISKMMKEAAKGKTVTSTRDLLVINLLATTGMRRAELCGIKIGDIARLRDKRIIQITGKGDKKRLIVLSEHVYDLIKKYLNMRGVSLQDKKLPLIISHSSNADPKAHVNTMTIYRIIKKYAKLAGIDESTISPHCLRATFATISYDALDMSADELRELMGHSSQATTQKYIKTVKMVKNSPSEKLQGMFEVE